MSETVRLAIPLSKAERQELLQSQIARANKTFTIDLNRILSTEDLLNNYTVNTSSNAFKNRLQLAGRVEIFLSKPNCSSGDDAKIDTQF